MKKLLIGLISIISIFGLLSCESGTNGLDPLNSDDGDNSLSKRHGGGNLSIPCPAEGEFAGFNALNPDYSVYNYTLWADKDTDVGDVSITNDDENIYVTYATNETLALEKVHVYLWTSLDDLPDSKPRARDADYSADDIDAPTYTIVIPADLVCDDNYYITARASVYEMEDDDEDDGDDGDDDDGDDDDGDDDDDEDDDHDNGGRGHNDHGNGNGHGHDDHGNGHGYGHDESVTAFAGDATSPACFDEAGRRWWSYVSYSVDCLASISGTVYEDADDSGDFGTDDAVFDGIVVTASGTDGNIYTSLTELDGSYLFASLPAGLDYTVISATPEGDYDADENAGGHIVAALADDITDVNFGFFNPVVLSSCGITSTLWTDNSTDVGTLSIANDESNLYITYDTNELVDLAEIHVNIGPTSTHAIETPSDYNANAYVDITGLPADAITVTIPFAAVGFTCADLMVVKAHAVLTVDGANAFGGTTFYEASKKSPWFYDTDYSSCCPADGPQ